MSECRRSQSGCSLLTRRGQTRGIRGAIWLCLALLLGLMAGVVAGMIFIMSPGFGIFYALTLLITYRFGVWESVKRQL